jgi:hypothetical protein
MQRQAPQQPGAEKDCGQLHRHRCWRPQPRPRQIAADGGQVHRQRCWRPQPQPRQTAATTDCRQGLRRTRWRRPPGEDAQAQASVQTQGDKRSQHERRSRPPPLAKPWRHRAAERTQGRQGRRPSPWGRDRRMGQRPGCSSSSATPLQAWPPPWTAAWAKQQQHHGRWAWPARPTAGTAERHRGLTPRGKGGGAGESRLTAGRRHPRCQWALERPPNPGGTPSETHTGQRPGQSSSSAVAGGRGHCPWQCSGAQQQPQRHHHSDTTAASGSGLRAAAAAPSR